MSARRSNTYIESVVIEEIDKIISERPRVDQPVDGASDMGGSDKPPKYISLKPPEGSGGIDFEPGKAAASIPNPYNMTGKQLSAAGLADITDLIKFGPIRKPNMLPEALNLIQLIVIALERYAIKSSGGKKKNLTTSEIIKIMRPFIDRFARKMTELVPSAISRATVGAYQLPGGDPFTIGKEIRKFFESSEAMKDLGRAITQRAIATIGMGVKNVSLTGLVIKVMFPKDDGNPQLVSRRREWLKAAARRTKSNNWKGKLLEAIWTAIRDTEKFYFTLPPLKSQDDTQASAAAPPKAQSSESAPAIPEIDLANLKEHPLYSEFPKDTELAKLETHYFDKLWNPIKSKLGSHGAAAEATNLSAFNKKRMAILKSDIDEQEKIKQLNQAIRARIKEMEGYYVQVMSGATAADAPAAAIKLPADPNVESIWCSVLSPNNTTGYQKAFANDELCKMDNRLNQLYHGGDKHGKGGLIGAKKAPGVVNTNKKYIAQRMGLGEDVEGQKKLLAKHLKYLEKKWIEVNSGAASSGATTSEKPSSGTGTRGARRASGSRGGSKKRRQEILSNQIKVPVKKIQTNLKGLFPKGSNTFKTGEADGKYGPETRDAIKALQILLNFVGDDVDGLYGPDTDNAYKDKLSTDLKLKLSGVKGDAIGVASGMSPEDIAKAALASATQGPAGGSTRSEIEKKIGTAKEGKQMNNLINIINEEIDSILSEKRRKYPPGFPGKVERQGVLLKSINRGIGEEITMTDIQFALAKKYPKFEAALKKKGGLGDYNRLTMRAIMKFQKEYRKQLGAKSKFNPRGGAKIDGLVGPNTFGVMTKVFPELKKLGDQKGMTVSDDKSVLTALDKVVGAKKGDARRTAFQKMIYKTPKEFFKFYSQLSKERRKYKLATDAERGFGGKSVKPAEKAKPKDGVRGKVQDVPLATGVGAASDLSDKLAAATGRSREDALKSARKKSRLNKEQKAPELSARQKSLGKSIADAAKSLQNPSKETTNARSVRLRDDMISDMRQTFIRSMAAIASTIKKSSDAGYIKKASALSSKIMKVGMTFKDPAVLSLIAAAQENARKSTNMLGTRKAPSGYSTLDDNQISAEAESFYKEMKGAFSGDAPKKLKKYLYGSDDGEETLRRISKAYGTKDGETFMQWVDGESRIPDADKEKLRKILSSSLN